MLGSKNKKGARSTTLFSEAASAMSDQTHDLWRCTVVPVCTVEMHGRTVGKRSDADNVHV